MALNKTATYGLLAAAAVLTTARGMKRRFSLKNSVIVVTGGSRGLGLALSGRIWEAGRAARNLWSQRRNVGART